MTAQPITLPPLVLPTRLDQLAAIPEEEAVWLAKQKRAQIHRAYRREVRHFMQALGIETAEQLHQLDYPAVITWERLQREQEGAAPTTARQRLAALSSLFKHLVQYGAASRNPVADVGRPAINRGEGSTAAFSKVQARRLLDAPPGHSLAGVRDRAVPAIGLQVGFRRAEIAALKVRDLHQNRGLDALRVTRKAAGACPWRSSRRPRSASAPMWKSPTRRPARFAAVPAAAWQRQAVRSSGPHGPPA